jgi:hypothetical protein
MVAAGLVYLEKWNIRRAAGGGLDIIIQPRGP